ncbi:MAG: hypothetical protein HY296_03220 [Thaumarchaeota archaeon]|nr:hypothetical protein [Nitrososphaerota archaeon]
MITIRLVGHIRTSVGRSVVELDEASVGAAELVRRVGAMSSLADPGFTVFNTLVMVEDGEAFVPTSDKKAIVSGQSVVLIPFSHGG